MMHKFLIILLYYDRPNMVKNALNSIKHLDYDNWELAFIDDGSKVCGEPVVRSMLPEYLDRIKFFRLNDTIEDKEKNEARYGSCMNQAIDESDADIVVVVCDDDALVSNYLTNLNNFFNNFPEELWAYCHVIEYNPETETAGPHLPIKISALNHNRIPVMPACILDSSQVVFKRQLFIDGTVRWPSPRSSCLDAVVFEKIQHIKGPCPWAGCYGQYKGIYPDQHGKRNVEMYYRPKDIANDPFI